MTPHVLDTEYHTNPRYGGFAFASVVIACYAGYFTTNTFFGPAERVPWVFLLGAIFTVFSLAGTHGFMRRGKWSMPLYYILQCALLTAIVLLSPLRGFFAIIVLPVVSQAIFDYRARGALLVGLYLYLLSVGVWYVPYGFNGVAQSMVSYAAAFAFTVAFTLITKQALVARQREETLRRELEFANQQLRESAQQTEELATTHERNRLAREIHDGVGHYLTVVKVQLDAAAALIPTDPDRARLAVEKAAKLTHEALDDVRRSVSTLRTDTTRPPLTESLRTLAADAQPVPELKFVGEPRPLPAAAEHALFRAAQEGFTNIRKHAQASAASVVVDYSQPAKVRLVISDNGRGVSPDNNCALGSAASPGFGLRGLRERVEVMGGKVDAGRNGEGFTLAVEVPA